MLDTGQSIQDTGIPYNLCEDVLDDLGYVVIIQADITDPKPLTILFADEPEERLCGGMGVETDSGQVWVMGMIEGGHWVDLLVPAKPPDQFQVVSWGMEDNPDDANDTPDEDGVYWAGINTTATSAKFVRDSEVLIWERQDLSSADGEVTAYLVLAD